MFVYGIGIFIVKDFLKIGIFLMIVGYILVIVFSLMYWKWFGLV